MKVGHGNITADQDGHAVYEELIRSLILALTYSPGQ
jgi:hypothetical protein